MRFAARFTDGEDPAIDRGSNDKALSYRGRGIHSPSRTIAPDHPPTRAFDGIQESVSAPHEHPILGDGRRRAHRPSGVHLPAHATLAREEGRIGVAGVLRRTAEHDRR